MAARPFTEADIKRAVKACRAAGLEPGAVEVRRDGTIRVLAAAALQSGPVDEFEQWKRDAGQAA